MNDRPGWARSCTCGQTPDGYFCNGCMAWAGTTHGDQASWSKPRDPERRLNTPANLERQAERLERHKREHKGILDKLADRARPCVNTGQTCECLPGSVAEAHCHSDKMREKPAPRSMRLDH